MITLKDQQNKVITRLSDPDGHFDVYRAALPVCTEAAQTVTFTPTKKCVPGIYLVGGYPVVTEKETSSVAGLTEYSNKIDGNELVLNSTNDKVVYEDPITVTLGNTTLTYSDGALIGSMAMAEISKDNADRAMDRYRLYVLKGTEAYSMYSDSYIGNSNSDIAFNPTGTIGTVTNPDPGECSNFFKRTNNSVWTNEAFTGQFTINSNTQIHFRLPNSLTGVVKGTDTTATAKTKMMNYIKSLYNNGTPIWFVLKTSSYGDANAFTKPSVPEVAADVETTCSVSSGKVLVSYLGNDFSHMVRKSMGASFSIASDQYISQTSTDGYPQVGSYRSSARPVDPSFIVSDQMHVVARTGIWALTDPAYDSCWCRNSNQFHIRLLNSLTGVVYGTDTATTAKQKMQAYLDKHPVYIWIPEHMV